MTGKMKNKFTTFIFSILDFSVTQAKVGSNSSLMKIKAVCMKQPSFGQSSGLFKSKSD